MKYSDAALLGRMESLSGYNGIPKDYHIVCVRRKIYEFDIFNDKLYLFKGEKFILATTCTTVAGGPALLGGWKKVNKKGVAVILADKIYYNSLSYGLHNGKMPALRQIRSFFYASDNNNDKKIDTNNGIEYSIRNTNLHFNSYNVFDKIINPIKRTIGSWSYGCIVCNNEMGYVNLITLTKSQKEVTLTLLNEF